ncbi:MAG: Hsp33 family molecular chaperone HslO, partial [Anaerolineae bacterium]|nr:Hsp33 family molecular chaperone HslO [Anaerolineae bacterium]
ALAYGLTAGALFGGTLKVGQRIALKFAGDGPLEKMVIEADAYGRVR